MKIVDNLEKWTVEVRREKSAHHNTTKFKVQGDKNSQNLIAYGWVLKSKSNELAMGLKNLGDMQAPIMAMQTEQDWPGDPPTHFDTNKFTSVFQGIVNTYGIPRYQEANPALFEVIMFPFLFGVMYGDIGHATVLLLVSIYFIRNEKELGKPGALGDMAGMAFGGRYMLLLMSIFALHGFHLQRYVLPEPTIVWHNMGAFEGATHKEQHWHPRTNCQPRRTRSGWILPGELQVASFPS